MNHNIIPLPSRLDSIYFHQGILLVLGYQPGQDIFLRFFSVQDHQIMLEAEIKFEESGKIIGIKNNIVYCVVGGPDFQDDDSEFSILALNFETKQIILNTKIQISCYYHIARYATQTIPTLFHLNDIYRVTQNGLAHYNVEMKIYLMTMITDDQCVAHTSNGIKLIMFDSNLDISFKDIGLGLSEDDTYFAMTTCNDHIIILGHNTETNISTIYSIRFYNLVTEDGFKYLEMACIGEIDIQEYLDLSPEQIKIYAVMIEEDIKVTVLFNMYNIDILEPYNIVIHYSIEQGNIQEIERVEYNQDLTLKKVIQSDDKIWGLNEEGRLNRLQ